jgi:hypothetical protein
MRMDCEAAREHLDAWALGTLDIYDQRQLESHVASCGACTSLADEALAHAALIGMAVPLRAASSTLKARVMASARALSDIGRVGVSRWWRSAAAMAATVALGAFTYGLVMQMQRDEARDDRAQIATASTAQAAELSAAKTQVVVMTASTGDLEERLATTSAVLDVTLQPDAEWTALEGTEIAPGAIGQCVWSKTQALGAFIANDLPAPPEGTGYTMWLVYENGWVNGGSFEVDDEGRGQLILRRVWTRSGGRLVGFAVTIEETTEPSRPSTELVLATNSDSAE